jgi:hypothetical protein
MKPAISRSERIFLVSVALFSYPEDGGDTFLRNFCGLPPDYAVLQHSYHCKILKFNNVEVPLGVKHLMGNSKQCLSPWLTNINAILPFWGPQTLHHRPDSVLSFSHTTYFSTLTKDTEDRLCGLLARVPGYISRGPGFDS